MIARRAFGLSAITIALLACTPNGASGPPPSDDPALPPSLPAPPVFKTFTIAELKAQRAASGQTWLEFLTEPTLRMGLYHLDAGATDGQSPHGQDEVYYIVNGSAVINVEGVDRTVGAGDAIFVRANAAHHFHTITETLDVLVVFAIKTPAPADDLLVYTPSEMAATRDSDTNVWNMFLTVPTMSLGLYMLPQAVGGDGSLTHTFDEINIVTAGASRFRIGDEEIDVAAGSIVYVEDGIPHRFLDLTEDTDILILWER